MEKKPMINPEVSIILPVYNSDRYVSKTIDSLLAQTFGDFELIIINDCSTDNSEKVIRGYTDSRIRYYFNEENKGLIYSLNKAIDLVNGRYIARMDADDICMPERLAMQKQWLDDHPDTSIVGCCVKLINEQDEPAGFWQADQQTVTAGSIRKRLPKENCLAHPSVMGRAVVFKQYRYKSYQQHIEDYDLWLRLAADGKKIEKLADNLLLYRIHSQSITSSKLKSSNFFIKYVHVKRKYLAGRLRQGKFNAFDFTVFLFLLTDIIKAFLKAIKKQLITKT